MLLKINGIQLMVELLPFKFNTSVGAFSNKLFEA